MPFLKETEPARGVALPVLPGIQRIVARNPSVMTYQGAQLQMPLLLFHDALPQPNSANTYGPLTGTDEALFLDLKGRALGVGVDGGVLTLSE